MERTFRIFSIYTCGCCEGRHQMFSYHEEGTGTREEWLEKARAMEAEFTSRRTHGNLDCFVLANGEHECLVPGWPKDDCVECMRNEPFVIDDEAYTRVLGSDGQAIAA